MRGQRVLRWGLHARNVQLAAVGALAAWALWRWLRKDSGRSKGHVDCKFVVNLLRLVRVVVPSVLCKESLQLLLLSAMLVYRTILSISIASVNGNIVRSIVSRDFPRFIRNLISLAAFAVPASFVNSGLDYLNKQLAVQFRENLTNYFLQKYLKGLVFYQMSNLDNRIPHPDQLLTQDIEKWANYASNMYSNLAKPLLDIVLFSRKLAEITGPEGPLGMLLWYLFSGFFIKVISPAFGKLIAQEQRNEGMLRGCHSDIVNNAEEIAFYRGGAWEQVRVNSALRQVVRHLNRILANKFWVGAADSVLVKYGAVAVAYSAMGLPVFGRKSQDYLATIHSDASTITRDYIRNSSLFTNLAKAIGRVVMSYKDVQHLAGYTSLMVDLDKALDELLQGKYSKTMIEGTPFSHLTRGKLELSEDIVIEEAPIAAPNGDILVNALSLHICRGTSVFISGPNGCGKSSLFRILGGLWPLFSGRITKPPHKAIYIIPQRAYLPPGTFRDQIIYPDSQADMHLKGTTDSQLMELLRLVNLDEIIAKRGGFEQEEDWNDTLSGGQRQRLGLCRMLYHSPIYAILDDCTSAVSQDIEGALYAHIKATGITLITVSHRENLMEYHDTVLRFDGEGGFQAFPIAHN